MLSLFTSLGLIKDSQSPLSKIPNYASLVFIELLRDSKNKYFVQFSFKNSSLEVSFFPICLWQPYIFLRVNLQSDKAHNSLYFL